MMLLLVVCNKITKDVQNSRNGIRVFDDYTGIIQSSRLEGVCIEDNSKIFFLFFNEKICCDPSLEMSR